MSSIYLQRILQFFEHVIRHDEENLFQSYGNVPEKGLGADHR